MKIAQRDGRILIRDANQTQTAIIKSWGGLMRWDRANKWWAGLESTELLDRLASMTRLPETVEAERQKRHRIQEAVDEERNRPANEVEPLVHYPVKESMYKHQIRAANMALLTFGVIEPAKEEVKK